MDANPLVPPSFLAQPRWRAEGREWLSALPTLAGAQCSRWGLNIDGPTMHGSNGIAIPVRRGGERLVLKLTPPDGRFHDEVRALRFWNGRGTVLLTHCDADAGALLLERLDHSRSLAAMPLADALPLIGAMMRRLAVQNAPADVPYTGDIAASRAAEMPAQWRRLGEPFERRILDRGVGAGRALSAVVDADVSPGAPARPALATTTAVNGDLHADQVLAGERESWLTVDPVLLRGDAEYDLARILWTRLDEMADDAEIRADLGMVVAAAHLDPDRALAWALFRTVDYWLWGLDNGLTEDPVRCARLFAALASPAGIRGSMWVGAA